MMTLANQSEFQRIVVEVRRPITRITLNNPPLNVIDVQMMSELLAALEQVQSNANTSKPSRSAL